jgi:peptidoglycan/xylan/chitin deacetylase (PgdA/CDA1 family)
MPAWGKGFVLAMVPVLWSSGPAEAQDHHGAHRRTPSSGSTSGQTQPTVSVTISDGAFSPNGDGREDQTTIHVATSADATVEVSVVDQAGLMRRTWTTTGSADVVWDGLDEGGTVVPDDRYTVRAVASDPVGSTTATVQVTVDTRSPDAAVFRVRPSRLVGRRAVRVHIRAWDRATPLDVILTIKDRIDRIAEVGFDIVPGKATLRWRPQYPQGGRLYPGLYVAGVTVHDDAGNVGRARPKAWRVERPTAARVIRRLDGAGARVALTIDDCHVPEAWARMLRVLRRTGAGATFFCPGRQIMASAALARRTVADGHVIGSHGWNHAVLTGLSRDEVARRLRADATAMWRTARDTTAPYMRPPEGAVNRTVTAVAGATGHPRVMLWDVDPQDWRRPPPNELVSTVVRRSRAGSVVVLHTLPGTAAALPGIIAGLRHRGLEPVGLPELFRAAGYR